jgi:Uma2 family endonuclease
MQAAARRTKLRPAEFHLGPTDNGRRLTWEEFECAEFHSGFVYELIDGRLAVAATPNPRHSAIEQWVYGDLSAYRRRFPQFVNHVSSSASVFIPSRPELTAPQPDIALYRGFDYERLDARDFTWREVSPILVIEIISPESPLKDLYRNVELYELVQSIFEYWIFDPRDGIRKTTLKVYRRRGKKWRNPIDVRPGEEYRPKNLPGFCLTMNPFQ